jgi:hypothetical protein
MQNIIRKTETEETIRKIPHRWEENIKKMLRE